MATSVVEPLEGSSSWSRPTSFPSGSRAALASVTKPSTCTNAPSSPRSAMGVSRPFGRRVVERHVLRVQQCRHRVG